MVECPKCQLRIVADEATRVAKVVIPPDTSDDQTLVTPPNSAAELTAIATEIHSSNSTSSQSLQHLEKGRVLGNRYEILEWIGGGGMGSIYSARRIHIGDIVAVKVLRPDVVTDAQSRERFQREARAAAKLHHPNAVVIHDFGQDPDGTTFIVMELLVGRSLRSALNQERSFSQTKALGILKQACAGIEAAHRLGIIHRDIKPDNIILLDSHDDTEHVKILDFGIAKLLDRTTDNLSSDPTLTQVGTVIGTPTYMSPEQCQGETLDARSDVYSLGVVLYEMLTGTQPFTAKNSTGLVIKHVTEAPRKLSAFNTDVSAAVENVVLKALAKKPEARQQSALDLSREFENAVTNKTVIVPVIDKPDEPVAAPADKVIKTSSKIPVFAVFGATTFLLVAAIGWWLLSRTPAALPQAKSQPNTAAGAAAALPVQAQEPEPLPSLSATPPDPPPGMVMVIGGEFRMGSDVSADIDRPSHEVKVLPFFIDKTEVTNEEYKTFLDETKRPAPPSWKENSFQQGQENFPVTDVTWEDASEYAKWAKKRLPTEAEWEFAARGTDNRVYPWGLEYQYGMASVTDNSTAEKQPGKLYPVGSFPGGQSPAGLQDMSGNVWEWTASELNAYPGGKLDAKPGYKNLKVIRGGSYKSDPKQATTTIRRGWPATRDDWPSGIAPDYSTTGFRCAKDVQ